MGLKNSKLKNENININNYTNLNDNQNTSDNIFEFDEENINEINKMNDNKKENQYYSNNILKKLYNAFHKTIDIFKKIILQKQTQNKKNIQNKAKEIKKLEKKQNILYRKNLLLLWISWLVNIIIFNNKELIDLFFFNTRLSKIVLFFSTIFTILETLNIINDKLNNHHNIIFIIYFSTLLFIIFKSLLYNKGWGWQIYLMVIIINFNHNLYN